MSTSFQLCDNSLCFSAVLTGLAPVKYAINLNKSDLLLPVVNGRECVQLVFIEHAVREGNKAFVAAAVMPEKVCLRHIERKAVVQNTFEILGFKILLLGSADGEERCRGHLLRVTDDNGVFAPCQSTDSLAGLHLGGFVEYNEIERFAVRIKILRRRNRAHKHAGAQSGNNALQLLEKLAYAHSASAVSDKLHYCAELRILCSLALEAWYFGRKTAEDLLLCKLHNLSVQLFKLFDLLFKLSARKVIQGIVAVYCPVCKALCNSLFVCSEYFVAFNAVKVCAHYGRHAQRHAALPAAVPHGPFVQLGQTLNNIVAQSNFIINQILALSRYGRCKVIKCKTCAHNLDPDLCKILCRCKVFSVAAEIRSEVVVSADLLQLVCKSLSLIGKPAYLFPVCKPAVIEISEIPGIDISQVLAYVLFILIANNLFKLRGKLILVHRALAVRRQLLDDISDSHSLHKEHFSVCFIILCKQSLCIQIQEAFIPALGNCLFVLFGIYVIAAHFAHIGQVHVNASCAAPSGRQLLPLQSRLACCIQRCCILKAFYCHSAALRKRLQRLSDFFKGFAARLRLFGKLVLHAARIFGLTDAKQGAVLDLPDLICSRDKLVYSAVGFIH